MMVSKLLSRTLIKSAGGYTIFNIFEKAVPFFLLPILTRYLNPTEYGTIAMMFVVLGVVEALVTIGMNSATMRIYFKPDQYDFYKFIGTTIILAFINGLILTAVCRIFSAFLSENIKLSNSHISILIGVGVLNFISNQLLVVWQAQNKVFNYGLIRIGISLLSFSSAVLLIVYLKFGWEGRLFGNAFAAFFGGIFAYFVLLKKGLKIKWSVEHVKYSLKFGLPLLPHMLSSFLLTTTDRILITNALGLAETGVYSVGFQIGSIIGILAMAFNKAWTPWFFKKMKDNSPQSKKGIVSITYLYLIFILSTGLFLGFIGPYLIKVFIGSDFIAASEYVIWIAMGFALKGVYYMFSNYIFYNEKTSLLTYTTVIILLINIPLTYFLIKVNGGIGAAQATTLTYLIQLLIVGTVIVRNFPMPWNTFKT